MGILKLFRRKQKNIRTRQLEEETEQRDNVPATCTTGYPYDQSGISRNVNIATTDHGGQTIHSFPTTSSSSSFKPTSLDLTSIVPNEKEGAATLHLTRNHDESSLLNSNHPPPPSCTNSSLRDRQKSSQQQQQQGRNSSTRNSPSVHFSPKHVIISSESSTIDLDRALSNADDERTCDTSTFATFKTNNSETSLQYLWKYITCNLGTTKSTFDLRMEDDFTIDSDLVSAWTGRTGDTDRTGNTNESLNYNKQKRVTWSAAS
jgi:hypothetical protein